MMTVLILLKEDSRHLQQFREQTAIMVAACDRMEQSASRAELLHHKRSYRRLAEEQDEMNSRHALRVRGISKRINLQP